MEGLFIIQNVRLQDHKWATKVTTFKQKDEEDNEESEPIEMEEARFEEILTERSGTRTKETRPIGVTNKLIDLLSENQREVMVMVQRNSDNIHQLKENVTTLTEGIQKIEEKFDYDDFMSLKLEFKKSLQAQKDIIKSNLNIEKDYSAVKAKLSTVYGREFFER